MHDIRIETEAVTLPLRFALAASRAAAVLGAIRQKPSVLPQALTSLKDIQQLLECAARGESVIRNESMADYSAEAFSAYRLVRAAKAGTALLPRVTQLIKELDVTVIPPSEQLDALKQEFETLAKAALRESAGPIEAYPVGLQPSGVQ